MFGAFLALASAALFGLNNATVRRGVLTATVLQGMAITVVLGVPLFLVLAPFFGAFGAMAGMTWQSWGWMALAGVVHFVIGRYGNYRATQTLGATLSTPVQQLSIIVSLALALVWLGESLSGLKVTGLLLVLIGPALVLGRRKQNAKAAKGKVFVPQYGPGFFWGGVCALGYGISPLFISFGLPEGSGLGAALAGVIVSYLAASAVVIALVMVAGGRHYLAGMGKPAMWWFVISTVCVALSQMLRYMALAFAPVSVVVPIQRLSVVFRLIFGAALNRDAEIMDRSVIVGILLSVLGAVALATETETARTFLEQAGLPSEGTVAAVLLQDWRP